MLIRRLNNTEFILLIIDHHKVHTNKLHLQYAVVWLSLNFLKCFSEVNNQKQNWKKEQCTFFTRNIQLSLVRYTHKNRADSFAQIWNWSSNLKIQVMPSRVYYIKHRKHLPQTSFQNIPCGPGSNKQNKSEQALKKSVEKSCWKVVCTNRGVLCDSHTFKKWKTLIIKY